MKIDSNAKSFAVVVNEARKVEGVLTDGDIWRGFIAEKSVSDNVMAAHIVSLNFCMRKI